MCAAAPARAQTASQLAPKIEAPKLPEKSDHDVLPREAPSPPPAPLGLDAAAVFSPSAIFLETPPPEESASLKTIIEALAGRDVRGAEVIETAAKVQAHLAERGYVLARVAILTDGAEHPTIRIRVIDGFIESLDLAQLPKGVRGRAQTLLRPLERQSWLRAKTLWRQIELVNQIPGANVSAAFVKGREFGGAILVAAARRRPLQVWGGIDNRVGSAFGASKQMLGIELDGLAGRGDRLTVQVSGNLTSRYFTPHPAYRAVVADMMMGLGAHGLAATASFVDVHAEPDLPPDALLVGSTFRRFSLGLRYPLRLAPATSIWAMAQLDAADDQSFIQRSTLQLSADRTRIARITLDAQFRNVPMLQTLHATWSQSLGIAGLGARTAKDTSNKVPLSRQRAGPGFHKSTLEIETRTALDKAKNWHLDTRLSGQFGFKRALLRSEQADLASPDLLSMFDSGTLSGDAMLAGRVEFSRVLRLPRAAFVPYAFSGLGQAWLHAPTALERPSIRARDAGIGARAQIATPGRGIVDLGAEYGVGRSTGRKEDRHLFLSARLWF